jgi:adenine-specific DNA-methyltransferase
VSNSSQSADATYHISIGSSFRTKRKEKAQGEGEIIGKIRLLKDVNILKPHRGHTDTLKDLKPRANINSFEDLYLQWLEVFDIKLLGKKFYQDVIKWYAWAIKEVQFPQLLPKANEYENIPNETYQEQSVLRMFTRLMFCWFMKERNLIPEKAFDKEVLQTEIKDFGTKDNYYKVVLQNMFFATLSVRMTERKFVKKYESDFRSKDFGNQYAYRHYKQVQNAEFIQQLFENVPFLNGGLFECLDKVERDENKKVIAETEKRIDGFSETQYKQAKVPDVLFFGEKANKGLVEIFEKYKFTVEENTPMEEEIALPPIMLGTVFENLLAYHTDDTGKEARKSKGAYYTPPEIVYYMVEESLLAFLKNKAPQPPTGGAKTPLPEGEGQGLTEKLENLVREKTTSNEFSPEETKLLIETLFSCKILDPACGSGAFPYTLLDKLVKVLNILDADNNYIKEILVAQKEKENQVVLQQLATEYLPKRNELLQNKKIVEQITIEELRKQNITELNNRLNELTARYAEQLQKLNEAFDPEENEKDYGKKLYLIQNCIFGVDILPIAIHISKLRFFLSLLISQKENPEKENRGILPLPNLDTKFIAANTLIAPEKDAQKPANMFITNIQAKQEAQKELRAKHLHANNHKDKEKFAKQDISLQKEIAEMLWLSYNNPRSFDNSVQIANFLQEIDIQTAP